MAESGDESQGQSGQEFRQKFEATQAEAAGLRKLVADQFGVEVDVLKDVPVDQIKTKAEEAVAARKAAEEAVIRKALGLSEDADLETALAKVKGGETTTTTQGQASAPFTSTGSLGGTAPPATDQTPVRGVDRIRRAVAAKS